MDCTDKPRYSVGQITRYNEGRTHVQCTSTDLEIFERGGGLQPLMTTFVHYSVRKGGLKP